MQWIQKRLLDIICAMISFTVNLLSTSGLRPLRLCHLFSAPNSRSTEEIKITAMGLNRVKRGRRTHSFLKRKLVDLDIYA